VEDEQLFGVFHAMNDIPLQNERFNELLNCNHQNHYNRAECHLSIDRTCHGCLRGISCSPGRESMGNAGIGGTCLVATRIDFDNIVGCFDSCCACPAIHSWIELVQDVKAVRSFIRAP
jgi:hypothetical protein